MNRIGKRLQGMCSFRKGICLLATVTAFFEVLFTVGLVESAEISDIREAWRRRQELATSVSYDWKVESWYASGSLVKITNPFEGPATVSETSTIPAKFPEKDTVTKRDFSVDLLSNSLFRMSRKGPKWDIGAGEFVDREYASIFDGKVGKEFYRRLSTEALSKGLINKHRSNYDLRDIFPLLINFRPLHPEVNALPDTAVIKLGEYRDEDSNCVIVEVAGSEENGFATEYWLDVEKDYSAVKVYRRIRGNIVRQFDIAYSLTESVGWIPISWSIAVLNQEGDIQLSMKTTLVDYEINKDLSEADFQFEFPVFTKVTDWTEKSPSTYVVGEGRKIRNVKRAELNARVPDSTLKTTSGPNETIGLTNQNTPPELSAFRFGFIIMNVVVVLIIIAGIVFFRQRRRE